MYKPTQVLDGIHDPRKILLELNKIYHRNIRDRTGIRVMDRDWDNLIILDACRYDIFEEINSIEGDLTSVISSDSSTSGFLKYNFGNDYFPDTVYISANPQVQRHEVGRRFHDCIRLWETEWDDDLNTVPPQNVTDTAIEIQEKYPNKRLIIHYIQPHYPFIGKVGQTIDHGSITGDGILKENREIHSIWDQLKSGAVEKDLVWSAYRENLIITLPEVERLLKSLRGKSVITSDHGNEFGNFGVYGHPGGVFLDSLINVPWLEINSKNRKVIKEGRIKQIADSVDKEVADRLADLGYV